LPPKQVSHRAAERQRVMSEFSTFYPFICGRLAFFSIGRPHSAAFDAAQPRQPNINPVSGGFLIANLTWLALLNQAGQRFPPMGAGGRYWSSVVIKPRLTKRFLVSAVVALATAALLARTEVFALVNVLDFGS